MSETLKEKKERLLKELKETETEIIETSRFDVKIEKESKLFNLSISRGKDGQSFSFPDLTAKDLAKINIATFNALKQDVQKELKEVDFDDLFKDFNVFFRHTFPKLRW